MSQDKRRLWHIAYMTISESKGKGVFIFPSIERDYTFCAHCGKEIPIMQAVGMSLTVDSECWLAASFCSNDCRADFENEVYENEEKYYKFIAESFSNAMQFFYKPEDKS